MRDSIIEHFNGNFLPFFEKYLQSPKKGSGNQYSACCCFHDDKKPSLSFNAQTGQFKCHKCDTSGDIFTFYAKSHGLSGNGDFPTVLKGIAADFGITDSNVPKLERMKKKIVAEYNYTDESGKMLFQVVRYEPKDFRQRQKNERGDWIWNLKGVKRVPYRLQELIKADEVIIVEGEKDADNLAELGFFATTCAMGAGKWLKEYGQYLKGKHAILMPDNDDEGKNYMHKVAASLNGLATSIKLIELPGLPEKGDVSDFITKFNDADEAGERLSIIIDQAEQYQLSENLEPTSDEFERGIITFQEFVEMEMPVKRVFLDPWITEQSITLSPAGKRFIT